VTHRRNELELYVDGGARGNPGPAACAFVLKEPEGNILGTEGFFLGQTTNNVAEYSGLIQGLQAAKKLGVKELHIFSDSELMVKQIIGEYRVKNKDLQELHRQVQRLLLAFDRWQIKHIRRELNADADFLVNETLDTGGNGSVKPKPKKKPHEPMTEQLTFLEKIAGDVNVKVLVEVVSPPTEENCPALMQKGQCFVFTEFVPAGICIHAAQSLLPAINALRHDPSSEIKNQMIKCDYPGCGAGFKLSILPA